MGSFWQLFSKENREDGLEPLPEDGTLGLSLQFSFKDLAAATANFAKENWVGSGAAGDVYRGCIHGSTEVAVKILKDGAELAETFASEVEVLSRFRHPNLVILLGWGEHSTRGTKLLVYEFMPGGSIGQRLYRSKLGVQDFPWQLRMRVACDAACGLAYMVNSRPRAFHRDIKPANILLDAGGVAKVADFGLASLTAFDGQTRLALEKISGTPGYVCPQCAKTGEVTEQSEVYSFGVVLLELCVNDELPARQGLDGGITYPLFQALQPWDKGALKRLQLRLDRNAAWPSSIVDSLGRLALQCVHNDSAVRPCFAEIARLLRRLRDTPNHVRQGRISDHLRSWAAANPPPTAQHHEAADIAHSCSRGTALALQVAPPAYGHYSGTGASQHRCTALPPKAILSGEALQRAQRMMHELMSHPHQSFRQ